MSTDDAPAARVMDGLTLSCFMNPKITAIPELRGFGVPEENEEPSTSGNGPVLANLPTSIREWRESLPADQVELSRSYEEERNGKQVAILHAEGSLLQSFMNFNRFTVLELDDLGQHMKSVHIPREVFKLVTVESLSLRHNRLRRLSADIGRMRSLKRLVLTGNKLRSDAPSLPFTLTFCRRLEVLHIDHNTLDAVPGVVALLPSLSTLYRHGNENYFRTTFMWYGQNTHDRVLAAGPPHASWWLPTDDRLPAPTTSQAIVGAEGAAVPANAMLANVLTPTTHHETLAAAAASAYSAAELFFSRGDFSLRPSTSPPKPPRVAHQPPGLKFLAARAVAQTKLNFFELQSLPVALQDYVASVYHAFNVCENCNSATTYDGRGFFTFTFRCVFLGNTYVPFQHWSCSVDCARAIERAVQAEEMRHPELHRCFSHVEDRQGPQLEGASRGSCRQCEAHGEVLGNSGKWCCGRCSVM